MKTPKVITRYADVCPTCGAFNSIKIYRSFKDSPAGRIAYGFCKVCDLRITIREIVKNLTTTK